MVDHVVERLSGEGDAERVHVREVGGGDVAGVVDLSEDDGLVGPAECPPLTDASFERASVGVEELARMFATDPVEEGLGLESGFVAEASFDGVPDVGKGIGSGAVIAWRFGLFSIAGQGAMVAVVSCSFFGHSSPPCRVCECGPRFEFSPESSYLAIRSHSQSSQLAESRGWQNCRKRGILIVADKGKLSDATQKPLPGSGTDPGQPHPARPRVRERWFRGPVAAVASGWTTVSGSGQPVGDGMATSRTSRQVWDWCSSFVDFRLTRSR